MSLASSVVHRSLAKSSNLHNYCPCFVYVHVYFALYVMFVNDDDIVHICCLLIFLWTTGRGELYTRILYVPSEQRGSQISIVFIQFAQNSLNIRYYAINMQLLSSCMYVSYCPTQCPCHMSLHGNTRVLIVEQQLLPIRITYHHPLLL